MRTTTSTSRLAVAACLTLLTACASPAPTASAAPAPPSATRAAAPASSATRAPVSALAGTGTVRAASAVTSAAGAQEAGAAVGRCRTTGLRARAGAADAGAGQRYAALVLTNTSRKSCWVYGFVGLIMIDGRGDALRTRVRRETVQPRRVTLRPGASAHARLHWTAVPTGKETRCPSAARLMVIPPDEVAHLEIPFSAEVCDDGRIDVSPMAPGTRL